MLSRILGTHVHRGAARACCRTPSTTASSVWGPHSASLFVSKRFVQFEQTSETLHGINTNKRALHNKWVTKSTKEYMSEADSKASKGNAALFSREREQRKERIEKRKSRFRDIASETDRTFDIEMDRMRDDRSRRFKKTFSFFKRQGKAFTLLYLLSYFGTLGILYVGFATGLFSKKAAFEFAYSLFGTYMDRDMFFQRVEAWDTYTNLGFAFVLNELLEFLRFPLVMFFFYQARPYLTGVNRRVKSSIFRFCATES